MLECSQRWQWLIDLNRPFSQKSIYCSLWCGSLPPPPPPAPPPPPIIYPLKNFDTKTVMQRSKILIGEKKKWNNKWWKNMQEHIQWVIPNSCTNFNILGAIVVENVWQKTVYEETHTYKEKAKAIYLLGILCMPLAHYVYSMPGPSCSKLMMSLVNDSLKFKLSATQIRWNFLPKKCE